MKGRDKKKRWFGGLNFLDQMKDVGEVCNTLMSSLEHKYSFFFPAARALSRESRKQGRGHFLSIVR